MNNPFNLLKKKRTCDACNCKLKEDEVKFEISMSAFVNKENRSWVDLVVCNKCGQPMDKLARTATALRAIQRKELAKGNEFATAGE